MSKRAVIYIRTSSEHQGEKASPDEQEVDCRKLAIEHDLIIVGVYRDIEKYRIKNRLVEPSGTRYDRPSLLAMLRDAAQGHFEVILAWREDRLYRGMRAMLLVLETIQEHKITILLARESFDPKIAPLKAWVAQMELDGMRERMMMGVKARLRAGKANTGQDRYGYRRAGETIEIVEDEARWVKQIYDWYNDRVPALEIRRRLITANAPQKGSQTPRRIQWARSSIQTILKGAKDYATGIKTQKMGEEVFEIPIPPIIDLATYKRFLKVRQENKTYPAHNIKRDYLLGGLLYCPCNRKWGSRTDNRIYGQVHGGKERKNPIGRYICPEEHTERIHPDCPRQIGCKKADDYVWVKVCDVISTPEVLLSGARQIVNGLRTQSDAFEAGRDRIQKELDALIIERQWVITQARKGGISESDMDYQLGTLAQQELSLKRDLASLGETIDLCALSNWEEQVSEYFANLQVGITSLNIPPADENERKEIFELKRQTVLNLVEKVVIGRDREIKVYFRLDLLAVLQSENHTIKNSDTCAARRCEGAH